MITHPTQSALNRQSGKYQLVERRENMLLAAEMLFLRSGLDNTSMIDIARQARITRRASALKYPFY